MNKYNSGTFYETMGNTIIENKDKIEKLEKQNARRKKENKELIKEIKAYSDMYFDKVAIINKAIKYIEDERKLNNEFDMIDIMNYEDFDVVYAEDILQILKGGENE